MHRGIVWRRESCSVVKPNNLILSYLSQILPLYHDFTSPNLGADVSVWVAFSHGRRRPP
jgi:hypothetical protein